jgi:heptaprenyl diphosphate synthase
MFYALQETGPEGARLRALLAGPVDDDDEVVEALTLLRASPGMVKAKDFLAQYAAEAHRELALLPDVAGRHALEALVDYTVSRHG